VVQKEAKGQEASRETVVGTNGPEVRVVNDEQKKQQEAEDEQTTPGPGAGEALCSIAEAIRSYLTWSPQRTFSSPFP
jgi:hypothetical protein